MNTELANTLQPWRGVSARLLQDLLADCGVELDGPNPFDIQVSDERALDRIVRQGSLGLGESYIDGQWQCERVDELVARLLRGAVHRRVTNTRVNAWLALTSRLCNLQTRARARIVGERHYDIGNALYEKMLDPYMNYSCAYWEHANTLEQAQRDKMDLICRKLELAPGMTVLDIGCGWGGMARYAVEHYGVQVVGITISEQQSAWAKARLKGLPIEIRRQDYRDIRGEFDRVLSIGMFEHVGYKNYPAFFCKCHELLRDDGLLLLHTIGGNTSTRYTDPWLHRYVFPNGMLPSITQIGRTIEPYFVLEDWHSFGPDYDGTLLAWQRRIDNAWEVFGDRYDERFRRLWNFYLLACAGAFRARNVQLWQLVLAKGGRSRSYRRPTLAVVSNITD